MRPKASDKPKRKPWIPPKKKVDLSRMDCCPEAAARAEALLRLTCACGCGQFGRPRKEDDPPHPDDMCIHHLRKGVGMGMRSVWWRTVQLLRKHHDGRWSWSTHGANRHKFHAACGTEEEMLERTNSRLPAELCRPAHGQV